MPILFPWLYPSILTVDFTKTLTTNMKYSQLRCKVCKFVAKFKSPYMMRFTNLFVNNALKIWLASFTTGTNQGLCLQIGLWIPIWTSKLCNELQNICGQSFVKTTVISPTIPTYCAYPYMPLQWRMFVKGNSSYVTKHWKHTYLPCPNHPLSGFYDLYNHIFHVHDFFSTFYVNDPSGKYQYIINLCKLAEDGSDNAIRQQELKLKGNAYIVGYYTNARVFGGSKYIIIYCCNRQINFVYNFLFDFVSLLIY